MKRVLRRVKKRKRPTKEYKEYVKEFGEPAELMVLDDWMSGAFHINFGAVSFAQRRGDL